MADLDQPSTAIGPDSGLRPTRWAVFYTFATTGAMFGSWSPRIPEVKESVGLSESALGLALLALGTGALAAMSLAGAAAARWGSGPTTRLFLAAYCLLAAPLGLVGSFWSLWMVIFLWGAAGGALDICMNSQGVAVERRLGRPVLSGFHAGFSLGVLVGVGVGSAGAGLGVPVAGQLGGFGLVLLAVGWPLTRAFVPDPPTEGPEAPMFALPRGRMLVLGVAAFAAMLCEGAVGDWSALHLRDVLGAGPAVAGLGFAAFSVAMIAGRLTGDAVTARIGRVRAIQIVSAVGAVGFAVGLAGGTVPAVVVGYALLGVGLSFVVPVIFGAAGENGGHAGPSIAAVFTCGYLGLLLGPSIVGGLADLVGLGTAMWLIVGLVGLVLLLAPSARTPT